MNFSGVLAMRKQLLIAGWLLALWPALAIPQADAFRATDRNGDGSISMEEWYGENVVAVPFTFVDLDGDGRISEREYREWSSMRGGSSLRGVTTADRFHAIDKNKDGIISLAEWKTGWLSENPFDSVDADEDGRISRREFSAWDGRRTPVVAEPAPPPGTSAPAMSERMRSLDRGGTGVAVPSGARSLPPSGSSLRPAPAPPATATLSTSPGASPGTSSPNMRSGSSLLTK